LRCKECHLTIPLAALLHGADCELALTSF